MGQDKWRVLIGKIFRFLGLNMGYGHCLRCGMPWNFTPKHFTVYTETEKCVALCEHCWSQIDIKERLPFYRKLYGYWRRRCNFKPLHRENWSHIKASVLKGY
jgi:DNA-directed RNA polymerase subunit RPC12/RpoP